MTIPIHDTAAVIAANTVNAIIRGAITALPEPLYGSSNAQLTLEHQEALR